jgi:hypothetical protein
LIFSVGWNGDFFSGNLKNFWGFGSQWNFDESFVGFSWALGQGWVVLGSGSEDLFQKQKPKIDERKLNWSRVGRETEFKLENYKIQRT